MFVPIVAVLLLLDDPSDTLPIDHPAIRYKDAIAVNSISRLNDRIASGELNLEYDPDHGYLRSLLDHLKIPISSQVLVFTKTSFQASKISPRIPRAIYHSDDVFVGWVRGGDVVEIAVTDPQLGVGFYTLDQEQVRKPRIERRGQECLQCHVGASTMGVPGLMVRSVVPDRSGMPVFPGPSHLTDHRSPLDRRWGGWYVSGTHGGMKHMGNSYVEKGESASAFDATAGQNVTNLDTAFTTTPYLAPTSDIVSLLLLEHRIRVINVLNRVSFEVRIKGQASRQALDIAAQALRMDDEASWSEPIKGAGKFSLDYESADPARRQLDLRTRLYRKKKSPMVVSPVFDGLPDGVKSILRERYSAVNGFKK